LIYEEAWIDGTGHCPDIMHHGIHQASLEFREITRSIIKELESGTPLETSGIHELYHLVEHFEPSVDKSVLLFEDDCE
jgi:hypothetical protein